MSVYYLAIGLDRPQKSREGIDESLDRLEARLCVGIDHLQQYEQKDILLLTHIEIDEARADARLLRHVFDRRFVEPLIREQLGRSGDDLTATPFDQRRILDYGGDVCLHRRCPSYAFACGACRTNACDSLMRSSARRL